MKLTFLGAAGEVTGSCYHIETENLNFLVDCGMFQGGAEAKIKNRRASELNPRRIDFVLLTHAHIDHSGWLPKLVADGFNGPIYATDATIDLLRVMLIDSARIQEKEAEWAQKAQRDFAPLYTVADAENCLTHFVATDYAGKIEPHAGVQCRFSNAGHILGSAIIEVWVTEAGETLKIVFSGDLGQPGYHIVQTPSHIDRADILLVESTYGDRTHKSLQETRDELVFAIEDTLRRKRGNVVIPSFTVGRTQDLLILLADLSRSGRLGDMNIYVDSPMATSATEITLKHRELFSREASEIMDWLLSQKTNPKVRFVQDVQESMSLNEIRSGAIIISASGMCDAGRIKHHLKFNLNRGECTVLITGFQAEGTLGRRLVDGAKNVRIFGEDIEVKADIYTIGGLSAHADQEGLLDWLSRFKSKPNRTFVVHGEPQSATALCRKIRDDLKWDVSVAEARESVRLS